MCSYNIHITSIWGEYTVFSPATLQVFHSMIPQKTRVATHLRQAAWVDIVLLLTAQHALLFFQFYSSSNFLWKSFLPSLLPWSVGRILTPLKFHGRVLIGLIKPTTLSFPLATILLQGEAIYAVISTEMRENLYYNFWEIPFSLSWNLLDYFVWACTNGDCYSFWDPRESPWFRGWGREKSIGELKVKAKLQMGDQKNGEKPGYWWYCLSC